MSNNPSPSITRRTVRRVSLRLTAGVATATLACLAAAAPPASAETLLASLKSHIAGGLAASCPATVVSTPFLLWGDSSLYSLVPGGSFESQSSEWTLLGGTKLAVGSEPFAVTGSLGKSSLAIPARGSAQSPFMCIGSTEDSFRFFLRSEASQSTLTAELIYKTSNGTTAVPISKVAATGIWAPSPKIATGGFIATLIAGTTVEVSLRFTATSGAARIDDVYLDPRMSR